MQADIVLDASAVLALLQQEAGADAVAATLPGAAISAVNLAEIGSKLSDAGISAEDSARVLAALGLQIVAFDADAAWATAALRDASRPAGLSLGDRACLALGRALGARVLTADRSWARVQLGVEVTLIR